MIEWPGAPLLLPETIPEDIKPLALAGVGNYAVQISWPDGLTQIATFELLYSLERCGPKGLQEA